MSTPGTGPTPPSGPHPPGAFPPPPGWGRPQPGLFPLRPLGAGEILGAAWQVARRNLVVLGPVALLTSLLASAVQLGVLALTGSTDAYLDPTIWTDAASTGRLPDQAGGLLLALGVSSLIAFGGQVLLAGMAAPLVAQGAIGAPYAGEVGRRWTGRWGALLLLALATAMLYLAGLALFIVPGILAYLAFLAAPAVMAMERADLGTAFKRSATLTAGHRGRILGVVVLMALVLVGVSLALGVLIGPLVGGLGDLATQVVIDIASAIVGAVTGAWGACVLAVLYVDLRIRKEQLAPALQAEASRLRFTKG
ncbi:hypothetical protein [Nakamurella leprariae]|uniref:Glycerophosphoryl diester phosphodiesterase membrane domain-containing protein n=1 Tax=Nakamurella leprariae TaxID=2803911 RepID=A0A939BZY8_9ACTN|nr:hypothetical protein [Nakamurella leprariae]MBM9468221.1 hypothetical protein [Nakamurella leprariae]